MSDTVRQQYEAYPYPARDPKDEAKRLISGSPSHLDELTHFLFRGRLERNPFRVLFAGGGTGDGLVMLAQQTHDADISAEITYLDLSSASRAIAEARIRARGLTNVRFVTGSLLSVSELAPGPYDYIDCCGVLHHLEDPDAGLAALKSVLAPGGGMGLMVYGALGRTGVYPMQRALRILDEGLTPDRQVALAKQLMAAIPNTNLFKRNAVLADHKASDAELYDLLLHSQDVPFSHDDVLAWLDRAGTALVSHALPTLYQPETYLSDPRLARRTADLSPATRAALAEDLSGAIKTHIVYAARAEEASDRIADVDDPKMIPILRAIDRERLAKSLAKGQPMSVTLEDQPISQAMPPLASAIIGRCDGQTSIGEIHEQLVALRGSLEWAEFKRQFDLAYDAMNGIGKMYLRAS
ncbi:MAG: class I SAM-dependent methyltransferase [Pseudomonadota bacterium]